MCHIRHSESLSGSLRSFKNAVAVYTKGEGQLPIRLDQGPSTIFSKTRLRPRNRNEQRNTFVIADLPWVVGKKIWQQCGFFGPWGRLYRRTQLLYDRSWIFSKIRTHQSVMMHEFLGFFVVQSGQFSTTFCAKFSKVNSLLDFCARRMKGLFFVSKLKEIQLYTAYWETPRLIRANISMKKSFLAGVLFSLHGNQKKKDQTLQFGVPGIIGPQKKKKTTSSELSQLGLATAKAKPTLTNFSESKLCFSF